MTPTGVVARKANDQEKLSSGFRLETAGKQKGISIKASHRVKAS